MRKKYKIKTGDSSNLSLPQITTTELLAELINREGVISGICSDGTQAILINLELVSSRKNGS